MDKGLQEVLAKLNSQKSSQTPKVEKKPEPKPEEAEDEDDDKEFFDDKENDKPEKADVKKEDEPLEQEKRAEIEMEMLNNNGRFRAELLYQLQEINNSLIVLVKILASK